MMQAPALDTMTQATIRIPRPDPSDTEDVLLALETAQALYARGEIQDAVRWLRKAADQAEQAGSDLRALELARAAAEMSAAGTASGASHATPAVPLSARPLRPPPPPKRPSQPAPVADALPFPTGRAGAPSNAAPPARTSGTVPSAAPALAAVATPGGAPTGLASSAPAPAPAPSAFTGGTGLNGLLGGASALGSTSSPPPATEPVIPAAARMATPNPQGGTASRPPAYPGSGGRGSVTPPPGSLPAMVAGVHPSVASIPSVPAATGSSPSATPTPLSRTPSSPVAASSAAVNPNASATSRSPQPAAAVSSLPANKATRNEPTVRKTPETTSGDIAKLVADHRAVRVSVKRSARDPSLLVVRRLEPGKSPGMGAHEAYLVITEPDSDWLDEPGEKAKS